MPRKSQRWKTISIPEEVFDEIKEIVKSHPYGYRSVSSFVLDSIRRNPEYRPFEVRQKGRYQVTGKPRRDE